MGSCTAKLQLDSDDKPNQHLQNENKCDLNKSVKDKQIMNEAKIEIDLQIFTTNDVCNGCTALKLATKAIALIAHNHMKPAMAKFANKYQDILIKFPLIGTRNTLNMVKQAMKHYDANELNILRYCSSGPFGGDAEISSELVNARIGCVIFFVDPLSVHPHQSDIDSLLRLARLHNILLATNETTAECIMELFQNAIQSNTKLPQCMYTLLDNTILNEENRTEHIKDMIPNAKSMNSLDIDAFEAKTKDPKSESHYNMVNEYRKQFKTAYKIIKDESQQLSTQYCNDGISSLQINRFIHILHEKDIPHTVIEDTLNFAIESDTFMKKDKPESDIDQSEVSEYQNII